MKYKSNITTLDQILNKNYGKKGALTGRNRSKSLKHSTLEPHLKKQDTNLA
jgi:hypothetical protein